PLLFVIVLMRSPLPPPPPFPYTTLFRSSLGLKESAWLTVHLMANDIATTGFAPEYVQFVLNLPSDFSTQLFKEYWQYVHQFCKEDRKSTRLNSSHVSISYAVFCLKKNKV